MGKLIAVLSLVVLLIPGVASANLLYNPGFELTGEAGHFTGWTQEYNDNIRAVGDNPHSGSWNATNYWDGGAYQNVAITGSEAYRLTGYVFIPAGTGGSPWGTYIGVKFLRANGTMAGQSQINMENATNYPRGQYNLGDTGTLIAPADAVTAMVRFGTWASDPWAPVNPTDFDDFDLSPIPEPTSLMLLGSGLIGLVGLTRKKRA